MPDITMCINGQCTLRDSCRRYRATPTKGRQAYGLFEQDENGDCKRFWDATGWTDLRTIEEIEGTEK